MAKNKLKACKACGAEIAVSAKSCPHCGAKNKRPFYKKAWFWILVVLIFLMSVGEGDGSSAEVSVPQTQIDGQNTVQVAATTLPVASENQVYHVGDTILSGNTKIVYMASGDYISTNEFLQPAEGNKYIFLKFAFENISDKTDTSASFYSFEAYADGYNVPMQYFDEETLSATLSAGRSTSGRIYFEVPENAEEIEVEYTENIITEEKITFVYEGDLESGYVIATTTNATEGALNVGQTTESRQLKINYLACFEDASNNQFIVPKEGCRYITCEFEFENLSDADQSVTAFSFNCFADGIACEGTYFRDDSLSATLSAGRKGKGTVTFEVPETATVVEVEYLSNFWTSNRVVFNAMPK